MSYQRKIERVNALQPVHKSDIRVAGAAIYLGNWEQHDPFLSMMNDRFKPGAFGLHPHRGFETVTYVLDGGLAHEDSKGGAGTLGVGDAQWMTTGLGVEHNEHPVDENFVHVLQLWINLPAKDKLVTSRYQDLRGANMPVRKMQGVEVKVFAGHSGEVEGPALTHSPLMMLDISMQAGAKFEQQLPSDFNGFIYIISGSGTFGSNTVQADATQTLWMDRDESQQDSQISLQAITDLHVILLAGQPLKEPVTAYGPFVMNTQQEIEEAIVDYQRGNFGI